MADDIFDAFISYNHGSDGRLATELRKGLQKFAKPWNKRRRMRVFLDRSSLALTSNLGNALHEKLGGAKFLILLASAESAASPWCNDEARFWVETKGPETLLLVLTDKNASLVWDGDNERFDPELSTALPPSLIDAFPAMPLYRNMAWVAEQGAAAVLDIRSQQFREDVATLSATILGKSKDDLDGEDVRQHNRFKTIRGIAIAALTVLTAAAVTAFVFALINAAEARSQAASSRSRELAARALTVAPSDPERGVLLAIEAMYPSGDTPKHATLDARNAVGQTLRLLVGGAGTNIGHIDTASDTLAISPDGQVLATAGIGGRVTLWDTVTGAERDDLGLGDNTVEADLLRFSVDGSWLLAAGATSNGCKELTSWNLYGTTRLDNCVGTEASGSATFSVDGEFGYAAIGGSVFEIDQRSAPGLGDLFPASRFPSTILELDRPVREIVPIDGGGMLVIDIDGRLHPFQLDSQFDTSSLPTNDIVGTAVSADGRSIAIETVGDNGDQIGIWRTSDSGLESIATVPIVRPASGPPTTSHLLSLRNDQSIATLGGWLPGSESSGDTLTVITASNQLVLVPLEHGDPQALAWLPDQDVVIVGSPSAADFVDVPGLSGYNPILSEVESEIGLEPLPTAVMIDGDATAVASDGFITVTDRSGVVLVRQPGTKPMAFSPTGARLAVIGPDGLLEIWDTGDWTTSRTAQGMGSCGGAITAVGWSSDESTLAVALHVDDAESCGSLFDIATGEFTHVVDLPGAAATAIAPWHDGVLMGFSTGRIVRYGPPTPFTLPTEHRRQVRSINVNPEGSRMVSSDGTFAIWDIATWTVLQSSEDLRLARNQLFEHVAFTPGGTELSAQGSTAIARWPDLDIELACRLVSDRALTEFEAAEQVESACRRTGLRT